MWKLKPYHFIFIFFFISNLYAAFDHNHKIFDDLLKKYVSFKGPQSYIDYQAIRKSPQELINYTNKLSKVTTKEFKSWDAQTRLSFLINAYNAFTIKLIVERHPKKSIKDLGHLFKSAWKIKFFQLLGEKIHLDYLEHTLIRKNFDEPRIHFAVVCASIGCPSLLNEAFLAKKLEQQFKRSIKMFFSDPKKNYYDSKKKTFNLSPIFKWYGDDFIKKYKSAIHFSAPHLGAPTPTNKMNINYTSYDWSLNTKQ